MSCCFRNSLYHGRAVLCYFVTVLFVREQDDATFVTVFIVREQDAAASAKVLNIGKQYDATFVTVFIVREQDAAASATVFIMRSKMPSSCSLPDQNFVHMQCTISFTASAQFC